MNLVLFEEHELDADILTLSDFRAKHIRTVLKLKGLPKLGIVHKKEDLYSNNTDVGNLRYKYRT